MEKTHKSEKKLGKIKVFLAVLSLLLFIFISTPSSSQDYLNSDSVSEKKEIEFLVLELPDSVGGGFEPHILAGPGLDGTEWLYIDSPTGLGSQLSGNLWISKDGGFTWEFKHTGRPPNNFGGSGDTYSAVFSDGTIVFTDLYLITVTVDTSLDGGDTWFQNPQASVTPIDDRQWLGIGPTVGGGPLSDSETLYLVYNQIPGGLYIQKSRITATGYGWIPGNAYRPVSSTTGSRDYFVVDQNDGALFLPNTEGRNLMMYVSTDGANTFTSYNVIETLDDIQNIFVVVDVDSAGNVYLTWCDKANIFLGVSKDRGQTWESTQVTTTPGARVLPWVTAGDAGRVGLTWYESDTEGDSDDTGDMANASWGVKAAICIDALSENRTFYITTIQDYVHTGTIKTTGASSSDSDRDLGDFFTCDVDELGRLVMTYGWDGDDGANTYEARVMFSKQIEGPFLRENTGPIANFTYEKEYLWVKVDASQSIDLNDKGITEYIWDWGDGSNSTGVDTTHIYNRSGTYNITLKVVNEDGLANTTTMAVKVSEMEEGFNICLPLVVVAIVLVAALAVYFFVYKKPKPVVVEPEPIPITEQPQIAQPTEGPQSPQETQG